MVFKQKRTPKRNLFIHFTTDLHPSLQKSHSYGVMGKEKDDYFNLDRI
jgi:hypothetical protein